jgi:molybdopterin molybdotransferase
VASLLTVDEARTRILERVGPIAGESVPLAQAEGRVLLEAACARVDLPPFPSSAMDGFALRAEDTPGTLPVVFRIAAGRPADSRLEPGEAMAIATGGAVPEGADAVVPIERVGDHGDRVEVPADVAAGENVRSRGGDVAAGDAVLPAGSLLAPAQLGALAAAGIAEVVCGRRPRVTIVTTGSELRAVGEPLGPGQIYESNGVMLEGVLKRCGADVERLRPVVDDRDAHRDAIRLGLEGDVLVTSGGVSVGEHDLVRQVQRDLGVEEVFWGVSVRPGKPLAFGVRDGTLVFGLPGNPVSSLVGCLLFVCPALLALQGATDPGPHFDAGLLAVALRRNPRRDELVRANRNPTRDGVELMPVEGQESHMIVRAAAADALVYVPRGEGELPRGAIVRYLRLA